MAQFYPLDHIDASANLFELEETCSENKVNKMLGWKRLTLNRLSGNEVFVLTSLDFQRGRGDLLMAS